MDGPMDGRSYGPTELWTDLRKDGRTDRPSSRDARTPLKSYFLISGASHFSHYGFEMGRSRTYLK